MNNDEILKHVDHTYLKPFATWENIEKLCNEALEYHTASVCIPPCFIKRVKETFPNLNICTVIGFPNGYQTTAVKKFEAIDISLYGLSEEEYRINTGNANSFGLINEGFTKLKEADIDFRVTLVINNNKGHQLSSFGETMSFTESLRRLVKRQHQLILHSHLRLYYL